MPELYLSLLDRILTPVLLVLAVLLLLVGHNHPGGGFIAGLVVAAAFLMQIITRGDQFVRTLIGRYLQPVMGVGLLLAVLAASSACCRVVFSMGFGGNSPWAKTSSNLARRRSLTLASFWW